MLHAFARSVIDMISHDNGFDRRAITAAMLGRLAEGRAIPDGLIGKGMDALANLPSDSAEDQSSPDLGSTPATTEALCHQLITVVVDHPQRIGRQLQRLWALCELWPHAARDERLHLRSAFLRSLRQTNAPEASYLTRATLRSWQRSIPTWISADQLTTSELEDMVARPTAQKAHFALSSYLGSGNDLATLANILNTLCARLLLQHFDNQAVLIENYVGTALFPCLAKAAPPTMMAIVVSQLAHHLWWCANDASLFRLSPGSPTDIPLAKAIRTGDMTASSRAARKLVMQKKPIWPILIECFEFLIDTGTLRWSEALGCTAATLERHGTAISLGPDPAAALATAYAALNYLNRHGSRPFHARATGGGA